MNRVQRRQFLIAAGALLATPLAVGAQQAAKVARIGYLTSSRGVNPHLPEAFRQGLRDLGYVEGRNLVIESREAEGKADRLPAFAAELVELKVDVIVAAPGTLAALVAKQATSTFDRAFSDMTRALVGALTLLPDASWIWRPRTACRRCTYRGSLSMPGPYVVRSEPA